MRIKGMITKGEHRPVLNQFFQTRFISAWGKKNTTYFKHRVFLVSYLDLACKDIQFFCYKHQNKVYIFIYSLYIFLYTLHCNTNWLPDYKHRLVCEWFAITMICYLFLFSIQIGELHVTLSCQLCSHIKNLQLLWQCYWLLLCMIGPLVDNENPYYTFLIELIQIVQLICDQDLWSRPTTSSTWSNL